MKQSIIIIINVAININIMRAIDISINFRNSIYEGGSYQMLKIFLII